MINFSCDRKDILKVLRSINTILAQSDKAKKDYILNFNFKPGKVEIIGFGVSMFINIKCNSFYNVAIPFPILWRLVQDSKDKRFVMEISQSRIKSKNIAIDSPLIKISQPDDSPQIEMDITPSKIEILALRNEYSIDELNDLNLINEVQQTEKELEEALLKCESVLNVFNITAAELNKLIEKKINAVTEPTKNKKILIINDDETLAYLLKEQLLEEGYSADTTYNGEFGLLALQRKNYDCLLLNLQMPGIQGEEVLEIVRKNKPDLPIVIMSAYEESKKRTECIKKGADYYITMPCDLDELLAVIERVMQLHAL